MLSWCERHAVGYIVGIAKNKRLNAMTAQRQREAQDCYAALGTKVAGLPISITQPATGIESVASSPILTTT